MTYDYQSEGGAERTLSNPECVGEWWLNSEAVFVCLFGCLWLGGSPRCARRPARDSPATHPTPGDPPNPVDILDNVCFEVLPCLQSEQFMLRSIDLARIPTMYALMHWRGYFF